MVGQCKSTICQKTMGSGVNYMNDEKENIEEEIPEEPTPSVPVQDSILNSVKKNLGYMPEYTEFDDDILMHINAAIFTLRQLGVGPSDGFAVTSAEQTYEDFLGEGNKEIPEVRLYLFMKVRLVWDTPQSSYVTEVLKKQIEEAEWRLSVQVDSSDTFE